MRGRKPKPTHLKVVTGNPGRRPLNDKEAKPAKLQRMPAPFPHLTAEAKREWRRRLPDLYKSGLVTRIDTAVFGAYCESWGIWVEAGQAISCHADNDPVTHGLVTKTTNGNAIQNPLVGTRNKAMADMVRYAAELGMTPSARTRIAADPPAGATDPSNKYF